MKEKDIGERSRMILIRECFEVVKNGAYDPTLTHLCLLYLANTMSLDAVVKERKPYTKKEVLNAIPGTGS